MHNENARDTCKFRGLALRFPVAHALRDRKLATPVPALSGVLLRTNTYR
jgi:hypothetical protein